MPNTDEVVDLAPEGERYVENPDFVPDPTHQFGTLDTSGTAGAAHSRIEEITPVFDIADAQNAVQAARALDPDDKDVDESLVVLPQGQTMEVVDKEAIRERLNAKAEKATAEPVSVLGPTQSQKEAAETGEEGAETAQEQQNDQGVGAPVTGDPEGTSRQTGGEDPAKSGSEAPKGEAKEKPAGRGR